MPALLNPTQLPALHCGEAAEVALGDRTYYLRPPRTPCATGGALGSLPLLVLVHCFGCSAIHELRKYTAAADAHGVALAVPEGVGSSWNAPHCCGPARQQSLDDVGFVDSVVRHASSALPIAADAVFAAGFSNGGFMTSHLAWTGTTRWAGISPAAGHEYSVKAERPLPVFIHHCAADSMVRIDGCCASSDGEPTCCCGIGAHRTTCVSTPTLFKEWLTVNKCSGSVQAVGVGGADCTLGINCAANTSMCVHGNGCFHQMWSRDFPATDAVVEFFAREACQLRGVWREAREGAPPRCRCRGAAAAKPPGHGHLCLAM